MGISFSPSNLDLWVWWMFAFAFAVPLTVAVAAKLATYSTHYPKMPGWVPAMLAVASGLVFVLSIAAWITSPNDLNHPSGFTGILVWSFILSIVELFVSLGFGIAWERNL